MNASKESARRGYEIYQGSPYHDEIFMDELNVQLVAEGFDPIHKRTFTHYEKLWLAGETTYTTINRWDVLHGKNV